MALKKMYFFTSIDKVVSEIVKYYFTQPYLLILKRSL